MGAFDSYIRGGCPDLPSNDVYVPNQSAFHLFEGFGIHELQSLLDGAIGKSQDTVWVPSKYNRGGHIGLRTWYVKALLESGELSSWKN